MLFYKLHEDKLVHAIIVASHFDEDLSIYTFKDGGSKDYYNGLYILK